jgi:3-oxoacyl-[acyl-carrier protein] reductase
MKYALITGATRGIGLAISTSLLQRGYHVYANYVKDDKAANKLKAGWGDQVTLIKGNAGYMRCINNIADLTLQTGLDCVVCNAAVTDYAPFERIEIEDWQYVMDINLTAPLFLIQQLTGLIRKDGRIIFIGAMLGHVPDGRSIPYSVSKAGIEILTKLLVHDFKNGITVNCIAPGFVATDWHEDKDLEHIERIKNKIALKRFSTTDEIARTALFIIDNGYINGEVINVNGGYGLV